MLRTRKRLLTSLSTISLIEVIGRHPAIAGILMLLGVGGGAGIANLLTPTIIPFISSNMNPNQPIGQTNNGLQPNGGTAGAMELPTNPLDSAAVYFEMTVNPSLAYSQSVEAPFIGAGLDANTTPGQPNFFFQRQWNGVQPGSFWWLGAGIALQTQGSATNPSGNYATGFFPFTASTTPSCTGRQPTGVWMPLTDSVSPASVFQQVDPGLGCPTGTPTLNAAAIVNIPGSGAQQATGAGSVTTTCAVVNGEAVVTAHVAVAHGLTPGLTYAMAGFTPTGYNSTPPLYTALLGTAGTTLVGTTGAASCPGAVTVEGTALSGTGGSITFPAVSTTNPFGSGSTGIITHNNQHICGWLVENGDDSTFPGSQAIEMVDDKGVALSGSPAVVPFLNQGMSSFSGGTGGVSSMTLTVSSLTTFTLTGTSTGDSSGYAHFATTAAHSMVPGTEFTVSGMTTSGPGNFNGTYVALAGTTGSTIVANPLSGPAGIPQSAGLTASGSSTSAGTFVTVITPGQTLVGTTSVVMPYGTSSTTGTATSQVGTYALSTATTIAGTTTLTLAYPAFYYSAAAAGNTAGGTLTARTQGSIGDFISLLGGGSTALAPSKVGWGGSLGNVAMLWGKIPQVAGTPSQSNLSTICTKQTDIQAYAAAQTTAGNPIKVNSLYRLNDLGIWGDSSNATITGYITNSSGTNATLNVVSTPYGSLALATGTEAAKLTGPGLPVASPVTIPLTTSASSTYALSVNTTPALGSSGSPVTFAVGAFSSATPLPSSTLKGYIDTTAGISTLHVTSFDNGTSHSGFVSFTGRLGTSWTASIVPGTGSNGVGTGQGLMTVTSPGGTPPGQSAYVGIGTLVRPPVGTPGAFTPTTVLGYATSPATPGAGYTGSYIVDVSQTVSSQLMFGSGVLPGPTNNVQTSCTVVGSFSTGMVLFDGGSTITGAPLLITGIGANGLTVNNNYYPSVASDAMIGTLSSVTPGEYVQNSTAPTPIVNPVKVLSYSGACGISGAFNGGLGCYTLSANPNASGAVGSSGSQVVFLGTTITDGGAIAPGPALTIDDKGPGLIFPVNYSTNLGSLALSGKYDVPTLGGTPSGIQVLVSNSANGPPLAGCTPCNWGALTGTISGGAWTGTIAGIPGGGPYFVSVRAANGIGYVTLPNSIRVGAAYALWGQGQAQSIPGNSSGNNTSWFSGLWEYVNGNTAYGFGSGESLLAGPPVSGGLTPAQSTMLAGDRYGIGANGLPASEATVSFEQNLTNAFGVPAAYFYPARDGVGIGLYTLGNVAQTQTVGSGTGSQTVWCSAAKFCGNVDTGAPLTFNAASLTGVWFNGSVSSNVLTVTTRYGGALEPGMVLGATGSPTVLRCLTSCTTPLNIDGSTWLLSSSAANGAAGTLTSPLRADPPSTMIPFGGTATPWPNLNIQTNGSQVYGFAGFGWPVVKAGTFKIIDTDPTTGIATTVCQDSGVFAYNNTGGNCTGAGVSGFVNYQTGDYQITFSTAPLSGHAITASWTNIVSPETVSNSTNRPQNLDVMGDGGVQSGFISSQFSKLPGGVSGHIFSGYGTDKGYMLNQSAPVNAGYQWGALAYSQMASWLYGTKFPAVIPGASANVPFMTTGQWRIEGPFLFSSPSLAWDGLHDQWTQDVATKSTFSGTVASNVLTLSADAVGPMWEGEVVNCAPVTTACAIGPLSGVYITSLAGGAWGKSGSTYNLAGSPPNVATAAAMQNPVYYSGAGPTLYLGTLNDIITLQTGLAGTTGRSPHPSNGFTGGRRATSRWAAMIYGANGGNATDPKVDRVKADAAGCDAAALAAPCFDIGTTYQASFSTATWSGNIVTISGGLAAHARPFVVGQAFSCSGCNSGLVITSLSVPPTQSTGAGAGEVGQTFTFIVKNAAGQAIGGSGSGAVIAGCSSVSGTGSNCIDVAVSINVGGTFGTAAAIDTCGANNINGSSPLYVVPNGKCQGNGIGEIVRAFRVGTNQLMYGTGTANPAPGSVFDDGVDIANGSFNQSAAFTANIVGAKVVQLVKAPAYSGGVLTGLGQWSSGSTYINYGDLTVVSGRINSLLGYVGGQSFPFTAGSGYTNGTQTIAATCSSMASGGTAPRFDVTVSGGAIVDVVPSAAASGNVPAGLGIGSTCTISLSALGGGTGGAISTIPVAPVEGFGGIGTFNTDNNTMGMFLYDNSGEPGNPLNSFFTNGMGGYFEPGLPVRPFGEFQGAVVSG